MNIEATTLDWKWNKRHIVPGMACLLVLLLFAFACQNTRNPNGELPQREAGLLHKAEAYVNSHPDSSLIFVDNLLKTAKITGDSLRNSIHLLRARAFYEEGKIDSALRILPALKDKCRIDRDTLNWLRAENLTGMTFILIGQTARAIGHAQTAYQLAVQSGHTIHQVKALVNLANFCSENNELVKSQSFLYRALRITKDCDSLAHISEVATRIATNYRTLGKLDSALWYGRLAVRMAEAYGVPIIRAQAYNNMGILFQDIQPDSAIYWYKQSQALDPTLEVRMNLISIAIQEGDYSGDVQNMLDSLMADCRAQKRWSGIARCHLQYSKIHEIKGEWRLAAEELEKAIRIGDSVGIGFVSMAGRQGLLEVFRKSGRLHEAVQLGDQLIRLKDSIERDEKMQALQQSNKSEKLQQELERKQEESGLNDVTNRKQKQVIILLLLALTLLVIIIIKARARNRKRLAESDLLIRRYREEAAKLKEQLKQSTPLSLFEKLVHHLEHDKPWLNPELKVDDILEKLNCTRKAITAALEHEQAPGLVYLVQQYRVQAAMRLMQDPRCKHYKIEAIATESGFGSYRTFHRVFVQITGRNPAEYLTDAARS